MRRSKLLSEGVRAGIQPWTRLNQLDCGAVDWINRIKGEVPRPGHTLDLVPGLGRVAGLFSGKGFQAFGIDYLPEATDEANRTT